MTEQDLITHYDENPDYWSPINKKSTFGIMSKLGVVLNKDSNILDIGCGDGRLLRLLTRRYDLYGIGIDYSKKRIQKARKLRSSNIYFTCRQIQNTVGLSQLSWNYGFMFEVLEHLENPRKVLNQYRELCDVLAGSVPLNMPYKAHLQVFESVADVEDRLGVQVKFVRTYKNANLAFWRTR